MKTKEISLSPHVSFGGDAITLILGPCSVESYEQTRTVGALIHKLGLKMIRGGAYKPRTSPHSFQGLVKKVSKFCALSPMNSICSWSAKRSAWSMSR